MNFDQLGLSPKVLDAVRAAGFTEPTPIQAKAIPAALERRDVLGLAQTGSGKTAAFTLPILTLLQKGRSRARMPRALILEPTRELAVQVHEAFSTLGKNSKTTVALLIGGVSFDQQDRLLDRGADVVIATPGRLLDHVENGKLMLHGVELFVVDEADRMLDMGFIPDIEKIYKLLPITRQTLFFSATMPAEIQRLTSTFLHMPETVEVARPSTTAASIEQHCVFTSGQPKDKRETLRRVLREQGENRGEIKNAIIFANRKVTVRLLERSLQRHGFNAAALHGDMDQHSRLATLERFRSGEVTFLIASDVAARGLDIPAVSHIFNFDVPTHAEDYVHRIGRTGRAGREGFAYTLVTPEETKYLKAIEKLIRREIPWDGEVPGEEDLAEKPRGRKGRGGRGSERRESQAKDNKAEDRKSDTKPRSDAKPRSGTGSDAKPQGRDKSRSRSRRKDEDYANDNVPFANLPPDQIPAFLQRPVR